MDDFHLLNDIELLNEFNLQTHEKATLIHKTGDNWEWSFYKKTLEKNVYNLLGFYRKGRQGFINSPLSVVYKNKIDPRTEVYPITVDRAVGKLYTSWRTHFEKHYFYTGLPNEFDRYWIDEESLIQDKFPDKWERISDLCLQKIKELAWIGKTKDYKSAWVYHKYRDTKLTETINNSILNDTCFYYSSEIFYHRFSSPFMYFSSKEKKEFDNRHWDDF